MVKAEHLLLRSASLVMNKFQPALQRARKTYCSVIQDEIMSQKLNKKEEQKEIYERRIFEKFAATVNSLNQLEIDLKSISNNRPPWPDIRCYISGKLHYFEMTEIVDDGLAKNVAIGRKEMKITGGAFSQDSPLLKAFTQKSIKTYPDLDGSLELLAYYDKQYPPPIELLKQDTLHTLNFVVQNMTDSGNWDRLWVYDGWNDQILGVISRQN